MEMKPENFASAANGFHRNGATKAELQTEAPFSAARPQLCRLSDLLDDWEKEAHEAYEARINGQQRGPITGISTLDADLGGALWPGLYIVHGQPGSGKTAFALQIAATCGVPSLFVSCEMAPLELLRRHTARVTGTFLQRLRSGEMRPHESMQLARRAIAAAPQLALIDATRCPAPPAYLLDCMRIVRAEEPHFLLIIDSAQSWAESMNNGSSEYETLNAGLAALRNLAHSLNCPILAISERNRESMSSGGLSAGAGSRKIEYGAEAILELGREPDARPDLTGEVPVKLRLAKNRHGAPGKSMALSFNGALQRFKVV